ncbi:MAG TPA: hypothetical protein VNZ01_14420 [Solirubrobacteraceae bacterium]|jgi:hypothetical protein|nr:hypothetical protein [Solirubrobacteraceae bacterium]
MMEIRSYRRVFDLERRIYRVDRVRLNPGGVPVRGVVYFLTAIVMSLALARLPLLGVPAAAMPWYLRDLILPGASAALLSVIRVEGRPFHVAASAIVRYSLGARWLSGFRRCRGPEDVWHPDEMLFLPDGSESRLRHLRYTGPGAMLISLRHERTLRARGAALSAWPATVDVRERPGGRPLDQGQVIAVGPRARVRIHATPGERRETP